MIVFFVMNADCFNELRFLLIQVLKGKIKVNDLRLQELAQEKQSLAGQSEATTKLKFKRANLTEKQGVYGRYWAELRSGVSASIHAIPGGVEITEESKASIMLQRLQTRLNEATSKKTDQDQKLQAQRQELGVAEGKLSSLTNNVDGMKLQLSRNMEKLQSNDIATLDAFARTFRQQDRKLQALDAEFKLESSQTEVCEAMYGSFLKGFENDHSCHVCFRDLSASELPVAVNALKRKISAVQAGEQTAEKGKKVERYKERLNELKSLQPVHDEAKRLQEELPGLETKITELVEQQTALKAAVSVTSDNSNSANRSIEVLKPLVTLAETICALQRQITATEEELVVENAALLKSVGNKNGRLLDEVQVCVFS